MKQDTVAAALNEARKFSALAQSVLSAAKDDKYLFSGTKLTGAMRRQSLELTRSLAEMRKR